MVTANLQDFLKDLKDNYSESMDKARDGVASGAWDGPPIPLTQEYRVTVDRGEYKASTRGPMQFAITFEITAPEEFAGRKLQEYYQPDGHSVGKEKLAQLIGALNVDLGGLGKDDYEGLAGRFVGGNLVIALRLWGDANDRYGVRWVNSDRGQNLKTDVKPIKPKTDSKALRPDVSIRKEEIATPAEADVATPAQPNVLPGGSRPSGGPNLPPGLRS